MTFGESWLASRITSPASCLRLGGMATNRFGDGASRSIAPNRRESASNSEGSSAASLADRGHQPPCANPQDKCAVFNRNRTVPIAGRCARAGRMCSVVADMCGLSRLVVRCCSCRDLLGAPVIRVSSPLRGAVKCVRISVWMFVGDYIRPYARASIRPNIAMRRNIIAIGSIRSNSM